MNFCSPLRRPRTIANVEGWSYLLLLFVAMPLKCLAGEPGAVRVVGMIHGLLVIAFCLGRGHAHVVYRWTAARSVLVLGATLALFGTLIVDRRLLSRLTPLREGPFHRERSTQALASAASLTRRLAR